MGWLALLTDQDYLGREGSLDVRSNKINNRNRSVRKINDRNRSTRRRAPKIAVRLLACGVATALLAACASSNSSGNSAKGPYVIGLTSDLAGPYAGFFGPINGALTAYVKYVNTHGGVNGRQLKVISLNDSGDAATAAVNYAQLKADGAVVIFANTPNTAINPLIPKAQADHIPMIWTNTNDGSPTPYIYGYAPDTPDSVLTELQFAINNLLHGAAPKVGIVGEGDPQVTAAMNQAMTGAVAKIPGAKLVDTEILPAASTSFTVGAEKLKAAGANVVIDSEGPGLDKIVSDALKAVGLNVPIVSYTFSYSIANLKSVNNPNFYVYYTALDPTLPDTPALQPMLSQAKAAGVSTSIGALYTEFYAVSVGLVNAIKQCGPSCTGAQLNAAMTSTATHSDTGGLTTDVGWTPTRHSFAATGQFVHLDSSGNVVNVGTPVVISSSFRFRQ